MLVQSLETSDRRFAVIRSRSLAAQGDLIFQRIAMAIKSKQSDFTLNYEMRIDLNELGRPSLLYVKAEPDEQDAENSAIRTALATIGEPAKEASRPDAKKSFSESIAEYSVKSQTKAQTKATYRSKLDHAQKFLAMPKRY